MRISVHPITKSTILHSFMQCPFMQCPYQGSTTSVWAQVVLLRGFQPKSLSYPHLQGVHAALTPTIQSAVEGFHVQRHLGVPPLGQHVHRLSINMLRVAQLFPNTVTAPARGWVTTSSTYTIWNATLPANPEACTSASIVLHTLTATFAQRHERHAI